MELIDAFSALRQRYDRYLDDYEQTVRGQSSIRGLEKLLRGKPSRQEEQAILDFYREVEQVVAVLVAQADPVLAARAVRFMLLDAQGWNMNSQLTVEAAQPLAIPLVALLPPADAAQILAAYKEKYPKRRNLAPRQCDLLRALEEHI